MGDSGVSFEPVVRYSKAQIGQAMANLARAKRAGKKLQRKQKALANKGKS